MRIDAHQHFCRYTPDEFIWIDDSMSCLRREFLPEHLEPELKRTGFDGSIAVQAPSNAKNPEHGAGINDQT
jgi:L-fuconolactonase